MNEMQAATGRCLGFSKVLSTICFLKLKCDVSTSQFNMLTPRFHFEKRIIDRTFFNITLLVSSRPSLFIIALLLVSLQTSSCHEIKYYYELKKINAGLVFSLLSVRVVGIHCALVRAFYHSLLPSFVTLLLFYFCYSLVTLIFCTYIT